LRSTKYSLLLVIGCILTMIGCFEKKKEIPRAAETMKKFNTVRIATYAVAAPFEFGKGTGVQGLDVDIGAEIGKALGFEVTWVKAFTYEQLFEYLRSGDAEIVISAVAIDPKLTKEFSFSHPYYDSWDILATQYAKLDIKGLDNLSGKNVGVATGRPGEALMIARKDVSLKKYATLDEALGGLNRAEVDAVVGDEPFLTYSSVDSFQNTMTRRDKVNTYQYAVVVRKTEPELLAKINETIDRMTATGEIEKIFKTLMGDRRAKAEARINELLAKEERRSAPKKIKVNVNKVSGTWNPDSLDGFKLVLESASGRYESSRILMDGNKGHCEFATLIPPGDYMLNIIILKMTVKVSVPRLEKSTLTMDLNIGHEASILLR
jgi:ABC-type amino acid transport substrate-binding protein